MMQAVAPAGFEQRSFRLPRNRLLQLTDRPLVVGVLNITPDSFSDGGRWEDPEKAIERALQMLEEGADLLDLGAESTRPGGGVYGTGARTLLPGEELSRLLPVLEGLREATDAPLSIDTRKGEVAREALAAGGDLINDVSAVSDPTLGEAVAAHGCPLILMHSRGELATMQSRVDFRDVAVEVRDELVAAAARASQQGISGEQIILDPGIGFGKTTQHNLILLRRLDLLTALGPVMVGASRKSFIGTIAGAALDERLPGSLATAAWAARKGAAMLRVHDVGETVQFLEVWTSIRDARGEEQ
jgi:dihydropteroate synthase